MNRSWSDMFFKAITITTHDLENVWNKETCSVVGSPRSTLIKSRRRGETDVDTRSWCTTPCTGRRGRRPRRRWSPHTASCCCTTCTPSCCWCIRCTSSAWRTACGTAWRCGWLRSRFKGLEHVTAFQPRGADDLHSKGTIKRLSDVNQVQLSDI